MTSKAYGYAVMAISLLAALVTFFITLSISNFFIAPSEHWRKSMYAVFMMKLGMAAGAAFWTFIIISSLLVGGKH